MSSTNEIQTCPSRMQQVGPWEYKENLDEWKTTRWEKDPELAEHRREAARAEGVNVGEFNDQWLWPGDVPRTCSFCGGIHPEDAIRLLTEGWTDDPTRKFYKCYLNPPAYDKWREKFMSALKTPGGVEHLGSLPKVWSPVPPVKVYFVHFTEEQLARFKNIILERK